MKLVRLFLIALQVLTCIPVRFKQEPDTEEYRKSLLFFPLVGLLLGLLLIVAAYLFSFFLPVSLSRLMIVAVLVILTGGLHQDGLADTVDALLSRKDRETALQIMKDSTIGPMGMMALAGCLAVKYIVLLEFIAPRLYTLLLFFPMLGRTAIVIGCCFFPYARDKGTGEVFIGKGGKIELLTAGIFCALVSLILLRVRGLVIFAVAAAVTFITGKLLLKKYQGLTGDILGFINEINELIALIGVSLIF